MEEIIITKNNKSITITAKEFEALHSTTEDGAENYPNWGSAQTLFHKILQLV